MKSLPIKSNSGTTFYVKQEFLKICSNPQEYDNYDLNKMGLIRYLHNELGPAVIHNEIVGYFIDGKQIDNKHQHKEITFFGKIDDLINEE